jgi:hypothetical protein
MNEQDCVDVSYDDEPLATNPFIFSDPADSYVVTPIPSKLGEMDQREAFLERAKQSLVGEPGGFDSVLELLKQVEEKQTSCAAAMAQATSLFSIHSDLLGGLASLLSPDDEETGIDKEIARLEKQREELREKIEELKRRKYGRCKVCDEVLLG